MYQQIRQSLQEEAMQDIHMKHLLTGRIRTLDEWKREFIKAEDACDWYNCAGPDEDNMCWHPDGFEVVDSGLIEVVKEDGVWVEA